MTAIQPTVANIQTIGYLVAHYYRHDVETFNSTARPEPLATHRQMAMSLACELTQASASAVARAFGKKDHGTVLHARAVVPEKLAQSWKLSADWAKLKAECQRTLGERT